MKETLFVFSSSRALESFFSQQETGFLPPSLTLEGFFSQALFVPNKTKAPLALQKVILAQVLKEFEFSSKERQFLFFEYNFLGFLETSSFLFSLFSEVFGSRVEFQSIAQRDIYGEYEDHLRVLERIYQSYQEKLLALGFYDFPREYEIFWDYLKSFSEIRFYIDGFLSRFEWSILLEISHQIPSFLNVHIDAFNLSHFAFLNSSLASNSSYLLSLPHGEIIKTSERKLESKFSLRACESRVDECSVVIERIQKWLKEGVDPDRIAVVLPKEDFALFLQASDEGKNFNYAMGRGIEDFIKETLKLQGEYGDPCTLVEKLKELIDQTRFSIKQKLLEVLTLFEVNIRLLKSFSSDEFLHLFIQEIKKLREDDNHGGKVRVIGMLETRGVEFDKVIVVDFNEENIPLVSYQDMFLNTQIRQNLGMPTLKDKQNLQKHYYLELFKNSQEVEIVFIQNKLSFFIQELGIRSKIEQNNFTLFPPQERKEYVEDEIDASLSEDFVFSSSSLRIFEQCRRQFYFSHIAKFREEKQNQSIFLGDVIHDLLCKTYQETSDFSSLKNIFEKKLFQKQLESSPKIEMEFMLARCAMEAFWQKELERVPDEILLLEHGFDFVWNEVRLKGRIDRVDRLGNTLRVIDYKFSDKASTDVIQGAIYYLYIQNLYPHCEIEVYLLPLKSGELHRVNVEEGVCKIEELLKEAKEERRFDKCISTKPCGECAFKILCNR